MYKHVKNNLEYEKYLDIISSSLRLYFVKLRISALPLRIQTGRYSGNNILRNERYCLCCNTADLEDEYHFIFSVSLLRSVKRYIYKTSAFC